MPAARQEEKYLELSCDLSELERIKECIFQLTDDPERNFPDPEIRNKICLACEEIFVNIVSYSGADQVQFVCNKDADKITVSFTDNGILFNPLEKENDKDFEDFDQGGMGIMITRQLCSAISYSSTDGKNILRMEFADI